MFNCYSSNSGPRSFRNSDQPSTSEDGTVNRVRFEAAVFSSAQLQAYLDLSLFLHVKRTSPTCAGAPTYSFSPPFFHAARYSEEREAKDVKYYASSLRQPFPLALTGHIRRSISTSLGERKPGKPAASIIAVIGCHNMTQRRVGRFLRYHVGRQR